MKGMFDLIVVATTMAKHKVFNALRRKGYYYGQDFIYAMDHIVVDNRMVTVFF
jgi:hypothetical protein